MYPDVSLFYPVSLYAPQSQGREGLGGPGPGSRLGKAGGSGQAAGDPGAGQLREGGCLPRTPLLCLLAAFFATNLCTLRL